ncbi:hypothetical protein Moror_7876 [Moniliophthora roreri MCA 2997]|uniref:Uncharacterized protein n=2 Tax=Moniliophthora roreri TaxID=221103 RepID=V2X8I9_MONRO|nr:hypothetical protein Moror_7876 [Moniliophthora roreri MCA 2997]
MRVASRSLALVPPIILADSLYIDLCYWCSILLADELTSRIMIGSADELSDVANSTFPEKLGSIGNRFSRRNPKHKEPKYVPSDTPLAIVSKLRHEGLLHECTHYEM